MFFVAKTEEEKVAFAEGESSFKDGVGMAACGYTGRLSVAWKAGWKSAAEAEMEWQKADFS